MNISSSEKKKKCTNCGKEIDSDWLFCPYCTNKNEILKCKFCGKAVDVDWTFCPSCTKKIRKPDSQIISDNGNEWLRGVLNK